MAATERGREVHQEGEAGTADPSVIKKFPSNSNNNTKKEGDVERMGLRATPA